MSKSGNEAKRESAETLRQRKSKDGDTARAVLANHVGELMRPKGQRMHATVCAQGYLS